MEIKFLNVDLVVESRAELTELITALGDDVLVLHSGKSAGGNMACFALPELLGDPDTIIQWFCSLIEQLPADAAKLWRGAYRKTFDLGYECGDRPRSFQSEVRYETVKWIAELGASLTITVYPRADSDAGSQGVGNDHA